MPDCVISNTTPLLSLLKIDRLELLPQLYGKIVVPQAVFEEIEIGQKRGIYRDISKIDWIEIRSLQNRELLSPLVKLDAGEAETIALALETGADLVIIDEFLGRSVARQFNLKMTGTLGILLRAKSENRLSAIRPLLEMLQRNGIWLDENLKKTVLKMAHEDY